MPREALLLTLCEVSITLVGFAGIVFFVGRRAAGDWTLSDSARMWGMLEAGFLTFLMTLIPFVVWELGVTEGTLWSISSAIAAGFGGVALFVWVRRGLRARAAADPEVSTAAGAAVCLVLLALLGLLVLNASGIGFERSFGPYLFVAVWLLMLSGILFLRLLRFW